MKDDKFKMPKGIISMKLYTTDCEYMENIKSKTFVTMWKRIVNEYLREFTYTAEMADLSFGISTAQNNVSFYWSGYNDSMGNYVVESVERILKMREENLLEQFMRCKDKVM